MHPFTFCTLPGADCHDCMASCVGHSWICNPFPVISCLYHCKILWRCIASLHINQSERRQISSFCVVVRAGFDLRVGQTSFLSDPLKDCFPVWLEKRLTGCLRIFPEILQQEFRRAFRSLTVYLGVQEVCQLVTLTSDIFFDILHGVHDVFYCRMSVHTIIFEFQLVWLNFLLFTFSTFALSRCFHGSWWSCILWPFVPLSIPPSRGLPPSGEEPLRNYFGSNLTLPHIWWYWGWYWVASAT